VRRYEDSVRFDGGERHAEIERVGDGLVRKLDERAGPSQADGAQRQIVAAERRSSRRQRPPVIAVNHSHVVRDVGRQITGTGNTFLGGGDGRLAM